MTDEELGLLRKLNAESKIRDLSEKEQSRLLELTGIYRKTYLSPEVNSMFEAVKDGFHDRDATIKKLAARITELEERISTKAEASRVAEIQNNLETKITALSANYRRSGGDNAIQ